MNQSKENKDNQTEEYSHLSSFSSRNNQEDLKNSSSNLVNVSDKISAYKSNHAHPFR